MSDNYTKKQRKEYYKIWYKRKCQEDPTYFSRWDEKRREKYPIKRLIKSAHSRAIEKELEFDLKESDFTLVEFCPYLGLKIDYSAGNGRNKLKPSLDRIDPTRGYIKDNVELISDLANRMKSDATKEELILFAKGVLKRE